MSRLEKKKKPDTNVMPTNAILESISDGVFTIDKVWRITCFNRAAEEITGISRNEAIGQNCFDVFKSSLCGPSCPLRRTLETGKPIISASGYIIRYDGSRIPISISTALLKDHTGRVIGGAETFRDLSEVEALRQELDSKYRIGDLVSRSPVMQRLFDIFPAIAASPSTVLLLGETGTGKELTARTIHSLSSRNHGPFIVVNCGALPDTLLESELFGYKTGAFSGAIKDKPGRFALAHHGTLFLDEIGEISQSMQIKLLRVLQDHTFEPLGAIRPETTDVRIIAATNRDLAGQVRQNVFREDLYYRINVVRIELPPLRQRKEDIPLLTDQLIARFNHLQHKTIRGLNTDAWSLLMAYHWPGNIRELANVIERAFILCQSGDIGIEHLPDELTAHRTMPSSQSDIRSAHDVLDRQTICSALSRNNNNRLAAARELGIHKTTLLRKMKKLHIPLPDQDGRSTRKRISQQ